MCGRTVAWQWHHPWVFVHPRGVPTLKWSIRLVSIMPGGFPEKESEVWVHSSYFIHLISKYGLLATLGHKGRIRTRRQDFKVWGSGRPSMRGLCAKNRPKVRSLPSGREAQAGVLTSLEAAVKEPGRGSGQQQPLFPQWG